VRNICLIVCSLLAPGIFAQQLEIAVQKGHSGDISAISFSGDATLLASAGADHVIKLWHVPTGKEMASFTSTVLSPPLNLEFLDDSNILQVTYEDGSQEKWNVVSSSLDKTLRSSPPKGHVAYVSKDGTYRVEIEKFYLRKKQVPTEKTIFAKVPIDISKRFKAIAVSESLKMILAGNEDAGVYAYDLETGKGMGLLEEHYASVDAVCFSSDNALFATASADRSIIIWNSETLRPLKRLFGKSFRYETLKFNHAGTQLAVGDELGYGRIIDLQSSRLRVSVARWHYQKVSAIRFSPDDSVIYSGGYDNRLSKYDLQSEKTESSIVYKRYISAGDFLLKKLGAYRDPYAWINSIDISPGGSSLAMGGGWRESALRKSAEPLSLKKLAPGGVSETLFAHQGAVNDVLFRNEHNFLSAGADLLVNWNYYSVTGRMYFRDKKMPGIGVITRILTAPGNTVLLQTENTLIHYDVDKEAVLDSVRVSKPITAVAVNPASGQLVYAQSNTLVFTNLSAWHDPPHAIIPQAHSDRITSIDVNPGRPIIATCSWDATVKLWDGESLKLLATVISIGTNDHIIITPDNYYYGTKSALNGIGFKYGKQFISPEQYDLRFNRPDIILDRIGFVPKQIVKAFNRAYLKRLQKMNFTEEMLSPEIHMPTLEFDADKIPINSSNDDLSFSVRATDTKYRLDRINVFVNNIPVFGVNGIPLRDQNISDRSQVINVKLASGRNKIQVSCLNEKGVESLLQTTEVEYNPPTVVRPDLYLAVISVSEYARPAMNLKYARKDGEDITSLFNRSGWYEHVYVDTLFDGKATLENIQQLRTFFAKATVEDEVICFVSGHGLLDKNLDFYFATHDTDFKDPASRGLRYEELEGLLDGISARKKLLLMDACHSGEVDKSRVQVTQVAADLGKNQKGTVTTYTYPPDIEAENYRVGITTSFELMQEVFANVTKGSGAIVISAAAGNSYALESDEWRNGVFTFSLLNGLKNKAADRNRDRAVTVMELKAFVSSEVEKLTEGAQRPTSRTENLEFDFRVW